MITRLVLAAGAGRRMGRTKALLDFGDRTALEIVAGLTIAGESETLVVTGHDQEAVTDEATRLGLRCVHNARWDDGRTTSVQAGLAARDERSRGVLVHPVDMPLVRQAEYDACLATWREADDARAIVVTSFDMRRGHPVLFGAAHFAAIEALGPDEPLRRVMHGNVDRVRHVVVANEGVLVDLDTPDDYEAARRRL